jgi:hypothetical protein
VDLKVRRQHTDQRGDEDTAEDGVEDCAADGEQHGEELGEERESGASERSGGHCHEPLRQWGGGCCAHTAHRPLPHRSASTFTDTRHCWEVSLSSQTGFFQTVWARLAGQDRSDGPPACRTGAEMVIPHTRNSSTLTASFSYSIMAETATAAAALSPVVALCNRRRLRTLESDHEEEGIKS